MEENKVRVYIIDDDDAVRDSLSVQLESTGYEVASFPSAIGFLEIATSLQPGCVISDVQMPDMDGMELQQRLNDMKLDFPVVIVTGHADVALAVRAMKAGAVDFIEKPFDEDAILNSVQHAQTRFAAQRASAQAGASAREKLATLTPREREVFDEMVRGKQNKMIAYDLDISPRTVEVHRARVLEKLEARSLSELVRLALAAGVPISS
ncbi:MAG TPA: response regulator FixJ [Stellaceae bacterium]|jgi:two-component system response regulator FixJ|nr:response regulator FixJ [Stellaceae bacterium]